MAPAVIVYEDCDSNTFPLEDWSASMITVLVMLIAKDNGRQKVSNETVNYLEL